MTRAKKLALLLVAAAALGLGAGGAGGDAAPSYLTAPVERGDLVTTVTATGTLNAVVTVKVGSQLSGQIQELLADFNDEVTRGQPIAVLDPETFAARVREAEAALEVAEAGVRIEDAAVEKAGADLANARAGGAVAEARVASAEAKRAAAERDLERKRTLRRRGTLAESEVDHALTEHDSAAALLRAVEAEREVQDATARAAEAALRMAEAARQNARAAVKQRRAALDQAELELARTVIRAPIDGVVIGRDVDRGQTVAASLEAPTLFTIAQDLRRMEVHAKVDEADIGLVAPGQRATFTVDAHPGRGFDGTVVQVRKAPEVLQNVVTYTVLISAENPDLLLLPGMTALVRIVVEQVEDVLKVPNAALRFQPPGDATAAIRRPTEGESEAAAAGAPGAVWIVGEDGRPAPVPISLGAGDAGATAVVAGPLDEGQEVIVGAAPADEGGGPSLFGLRLRL